MDLTSIMVGGIPLILVVIGITEFAKKLGVSGNASMVLAMALGIIFMVLIELAKQYPAISPYLQAVVIGLAIGLSATGLYDFSKKFQAPEK